MFIVADHGAPRSLRALNGAFCLDYGASGRRDNRNHHQLFYRRHKAYCHRVAQASRAQPSLFCRVCPAAFSALPTVGIALSALCAYKICEPLGDGYAMFGISMAAVGMLSIVGMIISNDTFQL